MAALQRPAALALWASLKVCHFAHFQNYHFHHLIDGLNDQIYHFVHFAQAMPRGETKDWVWFRKRTGGGGRG